MSNPVSPSSSESTPTDSARKWESQGKDDPSAMEVFEDYASSPESVVNDAIGMSATRSGEVEIVGCSRAAQQVLWSKSQNRPDMRASGYTRYEGFCHENNHSWVILGL